MTKLQAIKNSIKHWKRMRRWVKEVIDGGGGSDRSDGIIMRSYINETWSGSYCDLCSKYEHRCSKCPITEISVHCNIGIWTRINTAYTWNEWYLNSTKMLKLLKSLLPKKGGD